MLLVQAGQSDSPCGSVFFQKRVLLALVVPSLSMPPTELLAVLPMKMLLLIVSAPATLLIPPPKVLAELPEKVLLVTVSVAWLKIPPPEALFPFAIVNPEMLTVPELIVNTVTALFPE